jgi:meso-butanediol dehydrogenase / (S,S)-butanediol dehydrogenase / diacetyl reductase
MAERFKGKIVIGEATARRFVAEGAKVALVDRNKDSLEKVAKSLPADQVMVQAADVSDSCAVDGMVAAVMDRFVRLDVLVNNAGVHEGGDPTSITDEKWRAVMSTDVDGVFYGCRAALPHLEKIKGSIVNTASVSGTGGDWGMSPYNAAKGAVVNLTRALALDMGKKGVRVNAVCPSLTRAGMTEDMMDDKDLLAKFAERKPPLTHQRRLCDRLVAGGKPRIRHTLERATRDRTRIARLPPSVSSFGIIRFRDQIACRRFTGPAVNSGIPQIRRVRPPHRGPCRSAKGSRHSPASVGHEARAASVLCCQI